MDYKCGLVIYSGEIFIKTETDRCFMQSQIGSIKQCHMRYSNNLNRNLIKILFMMHYTFLDFTFRQNVKVIRCAKFYYIIQLSKLYYPIL